MHENVIHTQIDTSNVQKMLNGTSTVIEAASFTTEDRTKLMDLVQSSSGDKDSDAGAPAAASYENRSGGIVDVLNGMKEKGCEEGTGKDSCEEWLTRKEE